MMRLGQGLKILFLHELKDELMRRLLCLEALLHTYQKIFSAFPGDLEPRRDDLEGFRFVHCVYLTGIVPHPKCPSGVRSQKRMWNLGIAGYIVEAESPACRFSANAKAAETVSSM